MRLGGGCLCTTSTWSLRRGVLMMMVVERSFSIIGV